jgi:hypothetical protein
MKLFFCFNGTYEGDGKGGEGCIAGKGGIGPDEHPKFAFRTEAAAIRFRSKVDPFNDEDKKIITRISITILEVLQSKEIPRKCLKSLDT